MVPKMADMGKYPSVEEEIRALQTRLEELQHQRKEELLKKREELQRQIVEIDRQLGVEAKPTTRSRRLLVPSHDEIKQAVYKFLASQKGGVRGIRALSAGSGIKNAKALTNWIRKNPKLLKSTGVSPHVRYFIP
jgi:hypothetical protein